ncbi:hypothetical protein BDW42DRAFT_12775 [Aspergillus taichungensis]|uniref:LysM domain-containing protein n=1 Tax=Aspergillus taichungensis TaxID=482145 RepID=A0A2J5HJ64_9EURO|nr:hypothetical protein BDW42DRAFT_12775 [Aspergillus taichungensis]
MSSHRPASTTPGSSTNTSSAIRSRTRRLVSFTEDEDDDVNGKPLQSSGLSFLSPDLPPTRSGRSTPSSQPSRGISPVPMSHPSRATSPPNRAWSKDSLGFLDSSWSSLQSLASSFLGSDVAHPPPNGDPRGHVRKPSRPDPYSKAPTPASAWGPSAPASPEIGAGTQEERRALVQAKKREALLLADPVPTWSGDRRHKRRDSCDQTGHSAIDPEQDEEALAYIHHVQPTDSITGVTIRYGCQPAIFRKANGFWPSDSIQGRKTVLLPVESCTVKGRPIPPPAPPLNGNGVERDSLEDPKGSSIVPSTTSGESTPQHASFPETAVEAEADRVWKHESLVQIDGFSAPVEIGRVPRRALGFFPRTRRKSVSATGSAPPSTSARERTDTTSTSSSPIEPPSSASTPSGIPSSPAASRATQSPLSGGHRRQRSNIQLTVPGVGTLDRNATAPGPAPDGLSKFFAQHLPTLAPPTPAPDFRDSSEYLSTSISNATTGLENLGGAFEGWMRKVTTRAKNSLGELQRAQSYQASPPGRSGGRRGDLIELHDGIDTRTPSRGSAFLADPRGRADFNRSSSSFHDGATRRGLSNPSSTSTSRTRVGDRYKDD